MKEVYNTKNNGIVDPKTSEKVFKDNNLSLITIKQEMKELKE